MTRQIRIGNLKIGGNAPIVIQSMTKTDTRDAAATVRQIKELELAGCELIRVAVKDFQAASAIKKIKKKIKIPLVADIHFDYRLAIAAIENGADKIRLNPGNIHREEQVIEVARAAKKRKIPIRVGVNSGSIRSQVISHKPQATSHRLQVENMIKSVIDYINILERMEFYDIIVSLKASNVLTTIDAYRKFSRLSKYPLHLGVTAAGPLATGLVKSSLGIGILLSEGIGDTIRVSLTGDPVEEVTAAKNILQALSLRSFGPEIISCPTCGRCQVDLQKIVKQVEDYITHYTLRITRTKWPKIAIMGCEVNGPGEAKEADIGIAFGKGTGVLFKKGKIVKRVKEKEVIRELMKLIAQS
ncbi:MAG: flavodoxin-dependent (E)-4-hydroxy-3-methylbut-2-enyl-diphosphate synthase [Candidatus Omnitrophica bacterium]|nr:flavodoxin-dependent (E)-4-hydroxy-3-methylbut-2-enyl-diphosphate synthase [Candidatus Omnitrophota bacterium]MBU4149231.1 flavodoxin-dependent (E)-4-hydroxy-3-methylbut-2-enyl-diphosphate synthase [Candidatus Omnitrophota bacterium]